MLCITSVSRECAELGGVMKKEEKEPKEPKQESSRGDNKFIVSDKEQEEIAASYDNDGPFGIGYIKGK